MSNQKICEWCGKPFIAQKNGTKYCSKDCENEAIIASKEIVLAEGKLPKLPVSDEISAIYEKEFLSPKDLAKLLEVSKTTIYRYIQDGLIPALQLPGRTRIRRKDLDALFDNAPEYTKRVYHKKSKED